MSRRAKIEQMLADDPDDLFLRYALAMEFVSEGDVSAALATFDSVISADPNYVSAYFQKAQTLAAEGELDEARTVATTGVEAALRTGDSHAAAEMTGFLETL